MVSSRAAIPKSPIHMPHPRSVVIDSQSLPFAALPKIASVIEKPNLPNKLCRERKVARFAAGTLGATAAFRGAVINALGQERSNVAIAAGILTNKCMIAIIAICNPAADKSVTPIPNLLRMRMDFDAINDAAIIVKVR